MFLIVLFVHTSYSQDVIYSAIFKNVNKTAKNLKHHLNSTGDTLYLESKFDLNKIEIIGDGGLEIYAINNITKAIKVPLNALPTGDYTFAVVQTEGRDDTYIYTKTIIFKISRLLPIDSDISRGIKPLKSSMSLVSNNIPILDLEQNKIIKEYPELQVLASSEDIKSIDSDHELIGLLTDIGTTGSLSAIKEKEVLDEKHLRTRKIGNILERSKPVYSKVYNLTDIRYGNHNIQSRAEYRRNNLRPNGRPYD